MRTKVAGESCGATNASNGTSCASLLSRSEGSFILARAARQLVEGRIQKRAPQAFCELPTRICLRLSLAGGWCQITRGSCGTVESMRYDWSHATLAVTALPLPTTHRSLHGLRCRPHTLITRARPSDVTVDGALYCEPATARRPLGRAQAGGRQAETETPIMTSTLWGFSCSLQRR